jgi:5-methylthioadenosine/S-adenosylhomocysteine deaminase
VHEPGWVQIADGEIEAVGAGPPPPELAVVARGDLVMAGLVSAHQHTVDLLVAGGPTGPTFLDWLLGTYHSGLALADPEACSLAVGAVRAATLAAGVTTMVDCWSVGPVADAARVEACADASLEAHRASGGRTVFGVMSNEHPGSGWHTVPLPIDVADLCRDSDSSLAEVERLAAIHHRADGGRTSVTPAPELPETSSSRGLADAFALATRLGTVMPLHLCASPPSRAAYGPAELLRDGLADPRLLAAHVSAVDDDDVGALGGAGIGVAHCPRSAQALGSARLTPVGSLRRAGARCGIGLDNASLNPSRDLFAEARAAQRASVVAGDPLDATTLFRMLTTEGASAAGLDGVVGELRPGRQADLIVVDTSGPHWAPRRATWVETLVASATAADVRTVLVDGRVVVTSGVPVTGVDGRAIDRAVEHIATAMGWR